MSTLQSGNPQTSLMSKRFRRACFIVAALIVLVGTSECLAQSLSDVLHADTIDETAEEAFPEITLDTILSENSFSDMRNMVPENFEKEMFNLSEYSSVLVSSNKKVVGFLSAYDSQEVFEHCIKSLETKGWVRVESGYAGTATFVKEEGEFSWLLLNCTSISGETSVVVQFE